MGALLTTPLGRARVLLTLAAVECFGPAIRDAGTGHLLNPTWPGHARLHLMWLLGFMVLAGIFVLWQIWGRRPRGPADLVPVAAVLGCPLGGYWIAAATQDLYGGVLSVPGHHQEILGVEESIFAFSVFTTFWVLGVASLWQARRSG